MCVNLLNADAYKRSFNPEIGLPFLFFFSKPIAATELLHTMPAGNKSVQLQSRSMQLQSRYVYGTTVVVV